jgi:hypothetical protein
MEKSRINLKTLHHTKTNMWMSGSILIMHACVCVSACVCTWPVFGHVSTCRSGGVGVDVCVCVCVCE